MVIRTVQENDYGKLAGLYASFFKTHNIFQQEQAKVVAYLQEQKHELLVYEENGEIKGALFLVLLGQNVDGTHKLWKFRHFAFTSADIAGQLLAEAEKKVQESSKNAKIELTIAESEEGIEFYKANGYGQEGILKNHYRWGEICYILSKSFS